MPFPLGPDFLSCFGGFFWGFFLVGGVEKTNTKTKDSTVIFEPEPLC